MGEGRNWSHECLMQILIRSFSDRVYLTSESAPASTMWSVPPSQFIAVIANLNKDTQHISSFYLLPFSALPVSKESVYRCTVFIVLLVKYEWLIQVEEIHQKIFCFWQNYVFPRINIFCSTLFALLHTYW